MSKMQVWMVWCDNCDTSTYGKSVEIVRQQGWYIGRVAQGTLCPACRPEPVKIPDTVIHGTWNAYSNYKCRCPKCREAARIYMRDVRIPKYSDWL